MKLHVNTENKTVALEGEAEVATVFNLLMSWFPEDWEQWKFITYVEKVQYKEVIVEKQVWKNPYWNPFYVTNAGITTGNPLAQPKTTFNLNSI